VANGCKFSLHVLKFIEVSNWNRVVFCRSILQFRSDQSKIQYQLTVYGRKENVSVRININACEKRKSTGWTKLSLKSIYTPRFLIKCVRNIKASIMMMMTRRIAMPLLEHNSVKMNGTQEMFRYSPPVSPPTKKPMEPILETTKGRAEPDCTKSRREEFVSLSFPWRDRSRNSAVGIATGYGPSSPSRGTIVLFSTSSRPDLDPIQLSPWALSPGDKAAGELSWPHISSWYWGQEYVDLYIQSTIRVIM
jgi:hypothetical protein